MEDRAKLIFGFSLYAIFLQVILVIYFGSNNRNLEGGKLPREWQDILLLILGEVCLV